MKRILVALAFACLSVSAVAQTEHRVVATQYAQWKLYGNNNQYVWPYSTCQVQVGLGGGYKSLIPFATNAPVKIVDINPALTETVTPTAVNITPTQCSLTITPVNTHYSFYLTSGTGGLQEAINDQRALPAAVVVIPPDFEKYGGVTSMITAAQGTSAIAISDERTSPIASYQWDGFAYVLISTGGGGGSPPGGPRYAVQFNNGGVFGGDAQVTRDAAGNVRALSVNGVINPTLWPGADLGAQINNVCAALAGNPGEILIPAGAYTISAAANLCSHLKLHGAGATKTILSGDAVTLAGFGHQILSVHGAVGTPVTDVEIYDLSLADGAPTNNGFVPGEECIDVSNTQRVNIHDNSLANCMGLGAIQAQSASDLNIYNNSVNGFGHAGISVLQGGSHIRIDRNHVQNCLDTSYTQCYGIIAAGVNSYPINSQCSVDVVVSNNVVDNINEWEGLDTHCGDNISFLNNTVNGAYFGAQIGSENDPGYLITNIASTGTQATYTYTNQVGQPTLTTPIILQGNRVLIVGMRHSEFNYSDGPSPQIASSTFASGSGTFTILGTFPVLTSAADAGTASFGFLDGVKVDNNTLNQGYVDGKVYPVTSFSGTSGGGATPSTLSFTVSGTHSFQPGSRISVTSATPAFVARFPNQPFFGVVTSDDGATVKLQLAPGYYPAVASTPITGTAQLYSSYGIVFAGEGLGFGVYHFEALNNVLSGFGSSPGSGNDEAGAITLQSDFHGTIRNNTCITYWTSCVSIYLNNRDVQIEGNVGIDDLNNGAGDAVVYFPGGSNYGIDIDYNRSEPRDKAHAPHYLVYNSHNNSQITLGAHNKANYVKTLGSVGGALYGGGYVPASVSGLPDANYPVAFTYADGDQFFDQKGRPAYIATGPYPNQSPGYWSMDTTDIVALGTLTAGSSTIANLLSGQVTTISITGNVATATLNSNVAFVGNEKVGLAGFLKPTFLNGSVVTLTSSNRNVSCPKIDATNICTQVTFAFPHADYPATGDGGTLNLAGVGPSTYLPKGMNITIPLAGQIQAPQAPNVALQLTPANSTITAVSASTTTSLATFTGNNTFSGGLSVTVSGLTTTSLNATYTVQTATATQWTGAYTGTTNIASTPDSGTATPGANGTLNPAGTYCYVVWSQTFVGGATGNSLPSAETCSTPGPAGPSTAAVLVNWGPVNDPTASASGYGVGCRTHNAEQACAIVGGVNGTGFLDTGSVTPGSVSPAALPTTNTTVANLNAIITGDDNFTLTVDPVPAYSLTSAPIYYRGGSINNIQSTPDFEVVRGTKSYQPIQDRYGNVGAQSTQGTFSGSAGIGMRFNAGYTSQLTDNMHQYASNLPSCASFLDQNGFHYRCAAAGAADAATFTFFPTDLFAVDTAGNMSLPGQLNLKLLGGGGSTNCMYVNQSGLVGTTGSPCLTGSGTTGTTTAVLKGNGSGSATPATPGTDYVVPSGTVANATNAVTAANTTQVNGATIPPSQPCLGSDASSKIIGGTCGSGGTGGTPVGTNTFQKSSSAGGAFAASSVTETPAAGVYDPNPLVNTNGVAGVGTYHPLPIIAKRLIQQFPIVDITSPIFGAKCDGVTDDTAAMNSAVSNSIAFPVGSWPAVYLPPATCLMHDIVVPKNLKVFGDSPTTTMLKLPCDTGTATANTCAASLSGRKTMFKVRSNNGGIDAGGGLYNLTIYGAGASSTGTLVELQDATDYTLENVTMRDHGGRCLTFLGASERANTRNLRTDACRFAITADLTNETYLYNTHLTGGGYAATTDGLHVGATIYNINAVGGAFPAGNSLAVSSLTRNSSNVATLTYSTPLASAPAVGSTVTIADANAADASFVPNRGIVTVLASPAPTTTTFAYSNTGPTQTASGPVTVATTRWLADPHASVYLRAPTNFHWLGGSIKPSVAQGGIKTTGFEGVSIDHLYAEGYDAAHPTMNPSIWDGGFMENTTLTAGISNAPTVVAPANTDWFTNYYNTPADVPSANTGDLGILFPPDFLFGSTAASSLGGGRLRGDFECVRTNGYSPSGIHIGLRAQGCFGTGLTGVGAVAWPAGAQYEITGATQFNALVISNSHLNSQNAAAALPGTFGLPAGYSADQCDDATGVGNYQGHPCAEIVVGIMPDKVVSRGNTPGPLNYYSMGLDLEAGNRVSGPVRAYNNATVINDGMFQPLNAQLSDPNAALDIASNQQISNGIYGADTKGSAANLFAQSFDATHCSSLVYDDPINGIHSQNTCGTNNPSIATRRISSSINGVLVETNQYNYEKCWLDTANSAAGTNRICFHGAGDPLAGFTFEQFIAGSWVTQFKINGNTVTAPNFTGTASNATGINGAAVPANLACAGTDAASRIVAGTCGGGGGSVTSVAGRIGAVTLGVADVAGAEATANKGAASGYAALDASSLVPLANLPTIPYAKLTGVQASLGFTPQNAAVANANNAGIGACAAGQYLTGTAAGTTQPCGTPAGGGGGVTASSALTPNVVPKSTAAGAIADSSIDDGKTTANTVTISASGGLAVNKFTSTDTVNNSFDTYSNGSGGDTTCPLPLAGKNHTCNQNGALNISVSGAPYAPIAFWGSTTRTVDSFPVTGGTVGGTTYTSQVQYAAAFLNATITPTSSAELVFSCKTYITHGSIPLINQNIAGSPTLNLRGCAGVNSIQLDTSIAGQTINGGTTQMPVLYHADSTTNNQFSNGSIRDITVDANHLANAAIGLYAYYDLHYENVTGIGAIVTGAGSDHEIELGDNNLDGTSNPIGKVSDLWGGHANAPNSGGNNTGRGAVISTTLSGGVPVSTVTTGGSYYSGYWAVGVTGLTCSTYGTATASNGGVFPGPITSVTYSGYASCTGTPYTYVDGSANVQYGFKATNIGDAKHFDGVATGLGRTAGIFLGGGLTDAYNMHPIGTATGVKVGSRGMNLYGTYCDTLFHTCIEDNSTGGNTFHGTKWVNQVQPGNYISYSFTNATHTFHTTIEDDVNPGYWTGAGYSQISINGVNADAGFLPAWLSQSHSESADGTHTWILRTASAQIPATGTPIFTGLQLSSTAAGTCSAALAGQLQYTQGNATTKDIVQVCAHDAVNFYAWRSIY